MPSEWTDTVTEIELLWYMQVGSCPLAPPGLPQRFSGSLCCCFSPPFVSIPLFSQCAIQITLLTPDILFPLISFYCLWIVLESFYSSSCICMPSLCVSQDVFYTLQLKEISNDGLMSEPETYIFETGIYFSCVCVSVF